jgi:hypothetical protein
MESRNPIFTETGAIDCEINHPEFGWIPFTASADDVEPLGNEVFNALKYVATAYVEPYTDPAETFAAERTTMACTPMQGILALGEANWNTILAYRDTASWQEKVIIDSAQTWVRNSQNIAFFQYLLGFTDTQVDDLFRAAMLIDA